MRSKHIISAAGIMAAVASVAPATAKAADMVVKAAPQKLQPVSWTGFYIGGNAGYGWGDPKSHLIWESTATTTFNSPLTPADYTTKQSGAIGGFQAGYNYQFNAIVLGAEIDFQFANIGGSMTTPSTMLPNAGPDFAHFSESQKLKSLGTARGRFGFLPTDNLLLFATGGFAYGKVSSESHWQYDTPPFDHFDGSTTKTKTGYAVGGGAEWALNRTWSVKLEYLYYDLGTVKVVGSEVGDPKFFTFLDQKVTGNIVRGGLNLRF